MRLKILFFFIFLPAIGISQVRIANDSLFVKSQFYGTYGLGTSNSKGLLIEVMLLANRLNSEDQIEFERLVRDDLSDKPHFFGKEFAFDYQAPNSATYQQVINRQKRGSVNSYISETGEEFKVGDTLTLGISARNDNFNFILQNAVVAFYPLSNIAANSKVVIKSIDIEFKSVNVRTTTPQAHLYGLKIFNLDGALKSGEVKSNKLTSDSALEELKKWKDKLDLGLITESEYVTKRTELSKFIK